MKKLIFLSCILGVATTLFTTSCEELQTDLTQEEIVEGLKTALEVGTDTATTVLAATDGYLKDQAVKILLPPEAQTIRSNVKDFSKYIDDIYDFEGKLDDIEVGINRAAEDAASDAGPIFGDAITNLSITDGWAILKGTNPSEMKAGTETEFDSLAATHYLKSETFTDLVTVFSTPINAALDRHKIAGYSVNDVWTESTDTYNSTVQKYNTAIGFASLLDPSLKEKDEIESTDIGTYCTEKALDGLFLKVGEQERLIRRNPFDWSLDILRRVFGWEEE